MSKTTTSIVITDEDREFLRSRYKSVNFGITEVIKEYRRNFTWLKNTCKYCNGTGIINNNVSESEVSNG
mgnify:CR=1 FL=1